MEFWSEFSHALIFGFLIELEGGRGYGGLRRERGFCFGILEFGDVSAQYNVLH